MVRNFDEEFPIPQEEGPAFILSGQEFHAKKHLHPSWFLTKEEGVEQVVDFIERTLVPGERDVFRKLVEDPDTIISLEQLGEIANYIMAEVSGRPTPAAPTSGNGEETTS